MRLTMKLRCERCGSELRTNGEAYICSFECTFCGPCASDLLHLCSHCGGELVRRPRRLAPLSDVANVRSGTARFTGQRTIWLISFAVWAFIAFAAAFSLYQLGSVSFRRVLAQNLLSDLIYAVLTPPVIAGALRFPIWENNRNRRVLGYIAAAFAFVLVNTVLHGFVLPVWDPRVSHAVYPLFDPKTHAFSIQWFLYKRALLYSAVDDVFSIYLPVVLVGHIIGYYQRLRERELLTSQLETELAKAQLEMLKSHLQPHFLFNTLHSISALMHTDVGAADQMMTRLSDLLRLSLENRAIQITSLRRELEFVTGYLEIEKIRFQDRLKVTLDIAPEALDAQVPHLLLQPLTENAVRHGISKSVEPGEIRISASHNNQDLFLRVADDCRVVGGVKDNLVKTGLGLKTARHRLEKLYGDAQNFDIGKCPQGGFEVRIRIPLNMEVTSQNGAPAGDHP